MRRFFVTTIDREYDTLKKATVNVRSYTRRGKIVQAYTQQRITRGDVTKLMRKMGRSGGFSWRAWGKEVPTSGFMLGIKGHGEIFEKGTAIESGNFMNWLRKERQFVKSDHNHYYGGWYDKDDGKIYLDVSKNMGDKTEALRIMKETGEKKIWDVVNKVEINKGG
jgi:hypothetical protein